MRAALVICLLAPLAVLGCGESEQAKAEKSACQAKSAISASVQSIEHLTPQTASLSAVQGDVNAIAENLKKLEQAQGKLSGTRKEQIEKANETLKADLNSIKQTLPNLSLSSASVQLASAFEKLVSGYKQALAPIPC
jgi:hypothetical protein